ncbi:MAG: hypothetical protein ACYTHJ_17120 [Planctomycetota bacterium]
MAHPWFRFEQGPGCRLIGEDISFFEQAEALGYKPWVLPQVQCSHMRTVDLLDVLQAVWRERRGAPQSAHA